MITCPRTPGCTFCPECSDEARSVWRMANASDRTEYFGWLTEQDRKRGLRTAGSRGELRTNIHYQEDNMFQPRLKADGTPCCYKTLADGTLAYTASACKPCQDFAAERGRRARDLKAAENYDPPDPYKDGILRLQQADALAAAKRTHQPAPPSTEIHYDEHGVPDPYFHELQARKGATK